MFRRLILFIFPLLLLLGCSSDDNQIGDTTAPVITLLGDAEVILNREELYIDAGATAIDDVDGDISDRILIAGQVLTDNIGIYYLTYSATDDAGNIGSATRAIEIKPNSIDLLEGSWFVVITDSDNPSVTGDLTLTFTSNNDLFVNQIWSTGETANFTYEYTATLEEITLIEPDGTVEVLPYVIIENDTLILTTEDGDLELTRI
jgi:hypothetical protein